MPDYRGKTLMVYPYTREFTPALSWLARQGGEGPNRLLPVAFPGAGLGGHDAGYADDSRPVGLEVSDDFETALQEAEALLIPEGTYAGAARPLLMHALRRGAETGKEVYCAASLTAEEKAAVFAPFEKKTSRLTDLTAPRPGDLLQDVLPEGRCDLRPPAVPVVLVGELYPGLAPSDALLCLDSAFRRDGYRTAAVLPPPLGAALGLDQLPDFFLDPSVDEESKIYGMNAWMRRLEDERKPDVILIQCPGAMMRYNDEFPNGFGLKAFLLCQAFSPDCVVTAVPCDRVESLFYRELERDFSYRFGRAAGAFVMSNRMLDTLDTHERRCFTYHYLPPEIPVREVENRRREEADLPVFHLAEWEQQWGAEALYTHVRTVLGG